MSRPCTDLPITRVSVTNDGATDVVVAGVVVDVELVEVVDVEVVVVAVDVVVVELAAGSPVVEAVVADAVVVDCPCDVDEQATISWEMTSGATHHDLVLIGSGDQLGVMITPRSPYGIFLRLITPPTLAKNFVMWNMKTYFVLMPVRMASSCGPVTSSAVASLGVEPGLTTPRPLHGCTTTFDVCAKRLALPDPDDVQNPILLPSIDAAHTGVVIGVPSRL